MALRSISAGALLALALTACSGGEPAAEDAAAVAEAREAAVPATQMVPAAEPTPAETPAAAAAATPVAEATTTAAAPAPVAKPSAPAPASAPEVVKVAATVAPPASFARCATCHTADKGGEDKLGPNLFGTFGKPAGRGKFAFSDALKDAGLVLDEATLHQWLENPKALVPGNRMSFPGIKDVAKRQEIIDYLKQQS